MVEKAQDETIKDRIMGLLRKGYSRSQLINDFNFAERTVDNAIREYKELHGNDPGEAQKVTEPEGRELVLPAKLDSKAEAQSKTTETQLNILRAAKSESGEVARQAAQEAAQEAAARVAAYFEQKKPDVATTPDPMTGFMARAMDTLWNQITTRMFGRTEPGQIQLPPGWVDMRQKGGQ